ncbi:MAG: hypothetical protein ACYCZC_07320, partial [Acidithiobacillus sp.]
MKHYTKSKTNAQPVGPLTAAKPHIGQHQEAEQEMQRNGLKGGSMLRSMLLLGRASLAQHRSLAREQPQGAWRASMNRKTR